MMAEDPEHIFIHPEFGELHTTALQHCLDTDPSFDNLLFSSNEEIKRLFSPKCNHNSISQGHHRLNKWGGGVESPRSQAPKTVLSS